MAIYRPINESKTRVLIAELILSIPELVKKLAPDGLENSPYSYMKPITLEEEYRLYRYRRARKYKHNRLFVAGKDGSYMLQPTYLKSFEEFRMTFTPVPGDMPAEMIKLLQWGVLDIFGSECVVYDADLRSYSLGVIEYELFNKVINDLKIMEKDYLRTCGSGILVGQKEVGLIPIYEFIFEMLRQQGLEWEYRNINVINLWKIERPDSEEDDCFFDPEDLDNDDVEMDEQKYLEEEALMYRLIGIRERICLRHGYGEDDFFYPTKPYKFGYDIRGNRVPIGFLTDKALAQDHDSYVHLSEKPEIAESFEEEIERINSLEMPESGKLRAYWNVYGKWPKGYPISKFDYL